MSRVIWDIYSVRDFFKNIGYTLITDVYSSNKQKLTLKDSCGYYYTTNLNNSTNGSLPRKFDKSNPYSLSNIKLWLKLNNKEYELISDVYEGIHSQVTLKDCEGYLCVIKFINFINGKKPIKFDKVNKYTIDNIKLWISLNDKEFDLIDDLYLGTNEPIKFKCSKDGCGEIFYSKWNKIYQNRGCPYCSGKQVGVSNSLGDNYPNLIKEWDCKSNECSVYEVSIKSGYKANWICSTCSHEWIARVCDRTSIESGCPLCNASKGEKAVSEWLLNNGIDFIPQKTFDGLLGVGGKNLSYDFYLPSLNILIEYQGEQHESYCKGFHKDEGTFLKQVEHDGRKKSYAKNEKINLLEIWYYDFNNIANILKKELL